MGVLDRFTAQALARTAMETHTGRGTALRVHVTAEHLDSRHRCTLVLAQPQTGAMLSGLAAELGVVVERARSSTTCPGRRRSRLGAGTREHRSRPC